MKEIQFETERTQNAIDFSQMMQKSYENFRQFEDDIKWFKHNCRTIFSQNPEIQYASRELIGFVKEQIEEIQACKECYKNACKHGAKSLVMVCSQPHLLLWSENGMASYWPTKVMEVNVEKRQVHARFFGDYSWISWRYGSSHSDSFLYSKDHPQNRLLDHYPESYDTAIKVSLNFSQLKCLNNFF